MRIMANKKFIYSRSIRALETNGEGSQFHRKKPHLDLVKKWCIGGVRQKAKPSSSLRAAQDIE